MRTALAGLLLGLLVLAGPYHSHAGPTPVGAVMGGNVICDQTVITCGAFPVSASLLCDGTGAVINCPQYFAPDWVDGTGQRFFGLTNRANPPICVQSTNGGSTWVTCPTNPYAAVIARNNAGMSVASDGSLIVAAHQGANVCIIRRSTDYGANWSTVFTDTTVNDSCQHGNGSPTASNVRCHRTGGYCIVIGARDGIFILLNYFSTDNGASWTKSATTANIPSGDANYNSAVDDSDGALSRSAVNYTTGLMGARLGNPFAVTTAVPLPLGAGPNTRCTAPLIFDGAASVLCGPDSLNINTYRRFTVAAGAPPLLMNSFLITGAAAFANNPDIIATGFSSTIAYIVGRNPAGTQIITSITLDSFGSAPLLGTLTPTTALIAGCCRGDIVSWNNKIYFTIGAPGSNAVFGRIQ